MMPIHRLGGLLLTVIIAGCAVAPPTPAPVSPAVEERQRPVAAAAEPVHSPSEVQVMAAVDNENNVFFVLGSSGINAVGRKKVQDHARRLKADPKLEVTLVGYTDDLGSLSYNLAIAEQRVNAIHKELRSNGVRSNQIRRHVAGPEQLSPACRSTECRKKMRRVQFVYSD